jgi:hypothetical protein
VMREAETRDRIEASRTNRLDELQARLAGRVSRQAGVIEGGEQVLSSLRQPFARAATCIVCGEKTTDWITYYGAQGACLCRKCGGK